MKFYNHLYTHPCIPFLPYNPNFIVYNLHALGLNPVLLPSVGSLSNCLVIKESSATLKLDVGVIKIHLSLPLLLFYNQLLYDIVTPINPSIAAAAVPCHKVLKNSNCPKFPSTVMYSHISIISTPLIIV